MLLSSGGRNTHDRVEPLLHTISPQVSYVGEFGAGMHAKYTAYLLLGGQSLAAAEALAFAGTVGVDLRDVLRPRPRAAWARSDVHVVRQAAWLPSRSGAYRQA